MSNKKPESYSSLLSLDSEIEKKSKPTVKRNATGKSDSNNKSTRRSRSRSPKNKKMKPSETKGPMEEENIDWDIPDRQFGDLYCKPCDSHMNSDQMWEAHIQGKRHLKNVKKGDTASSDVKYDYLEEDPIMLKELDQETRPIVGLEHIVEIQRLEQRPVYSCFLCSANVPSADQLLEHIAGVKHRLAYLKEHDPERFGLIQRSNLKKGHVEPVVEECIATFEAQLGRGKMQVKRERKDYKSPPRKYKADYNSSSSKRPADKGKGRMERDRSFDRFDDPVRDRRYSEGRSDDLPPDYDRFGYRDSPPRSNRRHFDEDPRYPYEDDRYARDMNARHDGARPTFYEKYDGPRPLNLDKHARPPAVDEVHGRKMAEEKNALLELAEEKMRYMNSLNKDKYGDLREVLQNIKPKVDPTPIQTGASALDSLIGNIPEMTLQMIEAMSTTVFLQVAYFKLNRIKVESDLEMRLLDQVSNKCNSLSLEVKTKQLQKSNLQEQFKETIAQSLGITTQFKDDFKQMMAMVSQVKADSKAATQDNHLTQSLNYNSGGKFSDPAYSSPSYTTVDNAAATSRNTAAYSWQQVDSAAATAVPSYYSAPQIPGLTLTTDNAPPTNTQFDPFAVLSRHTKDLFGNAQNKTDSYRY